MIACYVYLRTHIHTGSYIDNNCFSYTVNAGRVSGNKTATLRCKAIYPTEVKIKEMAITVTEDIPDPVFTLKAPATWDGRSAIEVIPPPK